MHGSRHECTSGKACGYESIAGDYKEAAFRAFRRYNAVKIKQKIKTPLTVTKSVAFYVKTRTNKHKGKGFINYVYLRNPFASNFDKILATDEKN